jgi:hypothetical protein
MTKFVIIDGEEFKLSELYSCLEQIEEETLEDDHYGGYSLRDYELIYPKAMDRLVKMGLVKNYTGSRMANLYCMKDKKAIKSLLRTLYELDT